MNVGVGPLQEIYEMSESNKNAVALAVIAAIGGWGTAALSNWDKISGSSKPTVSVDAKKYADITDLAVRSISNGIYADSEVSEKLLSLDRYPGLTEEEVQYRGFKKAVFLRVASFNANQELLREALETVKKEGSGLTESSLARLNVEYKDILKAKLKWLKNDAVPQLRQRFTPPPGQQLQQQQQEACPGLNVAIPKDFWILPDVSIQQYVCDFTALEAEIALIQAAL